MVSLMPLLQCSDLAATSSMSYFPQNATLGVGARSPGALLFFLAMRTLRDRLRLTRPPSPLSACPSAGGTVGDGLEREVRGALEDVERMLVSAGCAQQRRPGAGGLGCFTPAAVLRE